MPERSASSARHLHPAAIAVWLIDGVGRLGLGLIPLLALGGLQRAVLGAALAFAVVAPALRWLRFEYVVEPALLTVRGGVVNRWRREIPAARVQTIEVVQKLRHRAFGVVELRIEVAGGGATEAALVALDPNEAERIRRVMAGEGTVERAPPEALPVVARMTTGDLVLAGFTGGRVAVIAVLLGYLQELAPDDVFESVARWLAVRGFGALWPVVAAAVAFLVVSGAISVVATVVSNWGFTVTRARGGLVVTRGLLERRRGQVALARIQAVAIEENIVRRALGLASVSVVVAGRSGPQDEHDETNLLLPIGRREVALRLAENVLEAPGELFAGLAAAPAAALWRRLAYVAAVAVGAAGVAVALLGPIGAGAVALGLPAGAIAWGQWRGLGYRIGERNVVVRRGALARRTTMVATENVQHLRLTASPSQRLLGLASLTFSIPKARPRAADVARSRAETLFVRVATLLSSGRGPSDRHESPPDSTPHPAWRASMRASRVEEKG